MLQTAKMQATRSIALLLAMTVVMVFSFITPHLIRQATAADVSAASDVLSDSDVSVAANHTISFTNTTQVDEGDTITITFPSGFSMGSVAEDDVDLHDGTNDHTTAADCTGSEEAGIGVSGQVITITICAGDGGAISASTAIVIEVGTNATASGTGANQVTNHATAATYNMTVGGTFGDTGLIPIVIIDDIAVSATITPSMTFTIAGVSSGTGNANGVTGNTDVTTTATTLPWGSISSGTEYEASHDLTVATNATNGFSVTIAQDQNLTNGSSDDIDIFDDGTDGAAATWSAPAATLGTENTYGHTGVTSEDSSLSGASDPFGTALFDAVPLITATPLEVFYHDGPADGTTAHQGATSIGYKIEVSALQEPGAYSNSYTYVATANL